VASLGSIAEGVDARGGTQLLVDATLSLPDALGATASSVSSGPGGVVEVWKETFGGPHVVPGRVLPYGVDVVEPPPSVATTRFSQSLSPSRGASAAASLNGSQLHVSTAVGTRSGAASPSTPLSRVGSRNKVCRGRVVCC
jgi:hypothetical protein